MSKLDDEIKEALEKSFKFTTEDGRNMAGMTLGEMPEPWKKIFSAVLKTQSFLLQQLFDQMGLTPDKALQIVLAAQGTIYASLCEGQQVGKLPEGLEDWDPDHEKAIDDMIATFRANARQLIDGTTTQARKGKMQ